MAPTPTTGGIAVSPYQQALLQQAAAAQQQAAGTPGIGLGSVLDVGATLAGARALGGAAPAAAAPAVAGAAPAAGRLAGVGRLVASPVGRAGLYGVGGYAAGRIADSVVGEHSNTTNDEALTGALTGAGIGAGIGSVVPGVGTLVGGGVGAVAGGLIGKFGGKSKGAGPAREELARQVAEIDKQAAAAGLDPNVRAALVSQLQTAGANATSKADVKALATQTAGAIPQLQVQVQQDQMQRSRALAYQAAMAPLLAQVLDRSAGSARQSQSMLDQAAGAVSGPLADAYRARGAQYVADTDQANAALAQQAMLAGAPQPGGQNALLQQILAQQAQQQGEAAAKKSGGGIKDIGQFITGTGVTDNLVQLYTMQMLMGAKGGRSLGATAGGV